MQPIKLIVLCVLLSSLLLAALVEAGNKDGDTIVMDGSGNIVFHEGGKKNKGGDTIVMKNRRRRRSAGHGFQFIDAAPRSLLR